MLHEVSFFVDLSVVHSGLKNFLSHLPLGSFHVLGDDLNLVKRQCVILELNQCHKRHIFGFSCGKDRPWKLFSCWGNLDSERSTGLCAVSPTVFTVLLWPEVWKPCFLDSRLDKALNWEGSTHMERLHWRSQSRCSSGGGDKTVLYKSVC